MTMIAENRFQRARKSAGLSGYQAAKMLNITVAELNAVEFTQQPYGLAIERFAVRGLTRSLNILAANGAQLPADLIDQVTAEMDDLLVELSKRDEV